MKMNRKILTIILLLIVGNKVCYADWFSIDSPAFLRDINDPGVTKAGDYMQYITNAIAAGVVIYKNDKPGIIQYGLTMGSSIGMSALMKGITGRARPINAHGVDTWDGPWHSSSSFFSGHTVATFAPAAFLYYRYGMKYAWPVFLMAGFTAFSRVQASAHYITDVTVGAAVGILMAKIFTRPFGNENLDIMPFGGMNNYGLNIVYRFNL